MATFTERLALLITADGSQAIREFKQVGTAAQAETAKAEAGIARTSKALTAFGVGAVGAGLVVGAGLLVAAKSAQDLQDSVEKAQAVFGKSDQLDKFAANSAKRIGESKAQALDLAATFGNIGKAAGIGSGALLTKIGTDLATRAADLAEQQKKPVADVQSAIISGLNGRAKALKALGVDLDTAKVKEFAYASGIAKTGAALTAQQKFLASYQLILKQTSSAVGAAADQKDIGVQLKIAKAEFENAKASLGAAALPTFTALVKEVSSVAEAFNRLSPGTKNAVGGFLAVGAGASVAVGALSLVAGQAVKVVGAVKGMAVAFAEARAAAVLAGTSSAAAASAVAAPWIAAAAAIAAAFALIKYGSDSDARNVKAILPNNGDAAGLVQKPQIDTAQKLLRLADKSYLAPITTVDELKDQAGRYDSTARKALFLKDAIDQLNGEFAAGDPAKAKVGIDNLKRSLELAGGSSKQVQAIVGPMYKALESAAATRRAEDNLNGVAGAMDGVGDAASGAVGDVDAFGFAVKSSADGAGDARNKFEIYADAIKNSTSPILAYQDALTGVEKASRSVARAQTDLAKARHDAASGSESAVKSLLDAERELYRARNTRITPEFSDLDSRRGILEAEQRVADAKAELAKSKKEAADQVKDLQAQLADAVRAQTTAGLTAAIALATLASELSKNPQLGLDAIVALQAAADKGLIPQSAVDAFKTFWQTAVKDVQGVSTEIDTAQSKLQQFADMLGGLDGKKVTTTVEVLEVWQQIPEHKPRTPETPGAKPYPYKPTSDNPFAGYVTENGQPVYAPSEKKNPFASYATPAPGAAAGSVVGRARAAAPIPASRLTPDAPTTVTSSGSIARIINPANYGPTAAQTAAVESYRQREIADLTAGGQQAKADAIRALPIATYAELKKKLSNPPIIFPGYKDGGFPAEIPPAPRGMIPGAGPSGRLFRAVESDPELIVSMAPVNKRRSLALLDQGARKFGASIAAPAFADGGFTMPTLNVPTITPPSSTSSSSSVSIGDTNITQTITTSDPMQAARKAARGVDRILAQRRRGALAGR